MASADEEDLVETVRRLRLENAQEKERNRRLEEAHRNTTFEEFLEMCHLNFHVLTGRLRSLVQSTQGTTTSVGNKLCPTTLREWEGFTLELENNFGGVYDYFHPSANQSDSSEIQTKQPLRPFRSKSFLTSLGEDLRKNILGSEGDLQIYQRVAVENYVVIVIEELTKDPNLRDMYKLGDGVVFENHTNTLNNEEVWEHRAKEQETDETGKAMLPQQSGKYADQICVRRSEGGPNSLLFIVEYKPPHKITTQILRKGLHSMTLSKIINRAKLSTTEPEKSIEIAEDLVAKVLTQTFSYMIESGVEYSYLTTGAAYVFLHIKADDPETLYYHLSEPAIDTQNILGPNAHSLNHNYTAIAQVLCLCLMAYRSQQRDNDWCTWAKQVVRTWKQSEEDILNDMTPIKKLGSDTPHSEYKGPKIPANPESPYNKYQMRNLRRLTKEINYCDDSPLKPKDRKEDPDPDDSFGGPKTNGTSSSAKWQTGGRGKADTATGQSNGAPKQSRNNKGKNQERPYCTQNCLNSLSQGAYLDLNCPNASLHLQTEGLPTCPRKLRHLINGDELLYLLQNQLERTMASNIRPLGKQGARGALFKITLASHGYTFVGKGTIDVYIKYLLWEADVYEHLERLQGSRIPVFLGCIPLKNCYFLAPGVQIVYFLLLSWGGERAYKTPDAPLLDYGQLESDLTALGVYHGDLRPDNILWNPESQQFMIIDFERSEYFDTKTGRFLTKRPMAESALDLGSPTSDSGEQDLVDSNVEESMSNDIELSNVMARDMDGPVGDAVAEEHFEDCKTPAIVPLASEMTADEYMPFAEAKPAAPDSVITNVSAPASTLSEESPEAIILDLTADSPPAQPLMQSSVTQDASAHSTPLSATPTKQRLALQPLSSNRLRSRELAADVSPSTSKIAVFVEQENQEVEIYNHAELKRDALSSLFEDLDVVDFTATSKHKSGTKTAADFDIWEDGDTQNENVVGAMA